MSHEMTDASKPTKGPCAVKFRKDDSCYISIGDPVNGPHKQFDMPFERSYANDEADAMLIEETFNVYTETGLTPRQLAEQRDELLRVLKKCRADMALLPASLAYDYLHFPDIDHAMDAIIAKVEAKP